jgi:hypothetical protein
MKTSEDNLRSQAREWLIDAQSVFQTRLDGLTMDAETNITPRLYAAVYCSWFPNPREFMSPVSNTVFDTMTRRFH